MFIPGLSSVVSPALPNFAHPLNRGLLGWWLAAPGYNGFGSDKWLDISGNHNHGTLTNMDPATDWGGASRLGGRGTLDFDGVNNRIDMGDVLDFEGTDPFSISVWVKSATATVTSAVEGLVVKQDADDPFNGWGLIIRGDASGDPFRFEMINNVSPGNRIEVDFDRPADTDWHHVVLTYDGSSNASGVQGYVDHVAKTMTIRQDSLTLSTLTTIPLQIGDRDSSFPFAGLIDDVRIDNRGLSASEVEQLYLESLASYPNLLQRIELPLVSTAAVVAGTRNPLVMGSTNLLRGKI